MNGDNGWFGLLVVAAMAGGVFWYNSQGEEEVLAEPRFTLDMPAAFLESGTVWRVDSSSVRGPRDKRLGWVIQDHSKDATVAERESKRLWEVNCRDRSYRILSIAGYTADGKVTYTDDTPDAKVMYAVPDSNAEGVIRLICHEGFDTSPE